MTRDKHKSSKIYRLPEKFTRLLDCKVLCFQQFAFGKRFAQAIAPTEQASGQAESRHKMQTTSYSELMAASGTLSRAAKYLLASQTGKCDIAIAEAMGTLLGLAYMVRPVKPVFEA